MAGKQREECNKLGLSCAKLSIIWSWSIFLFGSVASLKFDCLVQTGTITAKDIQYLWRGWTYVAQMLNGQIMHGQMLH